MQRLNTKLIRCRPVDSLFQPSNLLKILVVQLISGRFQQLQGLSTHQLALTNPSMTAMDLRSWSLRTTLCIRALHFMWRLQLKTEEVMLTLDHSPCTWAVLLNQLLFQITLHWSFQTQSQLEFLLPAFTCFTCRFQTEHGVWTLTTQL